MWWLENKTRSCPSHRPCVSPMATGRPVASPPKPPKETTRPPARKPPQAPLIDLLTAAQDEANQVLSEVQCGHEVEIERLLDDVSSLEKSVRQAAATTEQQQAAIEMKESQLQVAEEKAESLENTVAQLEHEVRRMQAAMQNQSEHQQAELSGVREAFSASELTCQIKEDQIRELLPLQDCLADAQASVESWRSETFRSHTAKRALSEQIARQEAVFDQEKNRMMCRLGEANDLAADQKQQQRRRRQQAYVSVLRIERLTSKARCHQAEFIALGQQFGQQRQCREAEVSRVQRGSIDQTVSRAIETAVLTDEIAALQATIATNEEELQAAWRSSEVAATALHLQELALERASETETRIVEMQSDQFETLQNRIHHLVWDLEQAQASEQEHRSQAEREQKGQWHETAKLRAQLSGGKARGSLLMEQYTDRLQVAKRTIAQLRATRDKMKAIIAKQQAAQNPRAGSQNRAA